MCYFISAHANEDADWEGLCAHLRSYLPTVEKLPAISSGYFDTGKSVSFHFTNCTICDCDSHLGRGQITSEIQTCFDALNNLRNVSRLKYLAILKHWHNHAFDFEKDIAYQVKKTHIDELSAADVANLEDDVFLKVLYYHRNW